MRSPKQIQDQLDLVETWTEAGYTDFPDETYEEGVRDALQWAIGQAEPLPISEEFTGDTDSDDPDDDDEDDGEEDDESED